MKCLKNSSKIVTIFKQNQRQLGFYLHFLHVRLRIRFWFTGGPRLICCDEMRAFFLIFFVVYMFCLKFLPISDEKFLIFWKIWWEWNSINQKKLKKFQKTVHYWTNITKILHLMWYDENLKKILKKTKHYTTLK